MSSAESSAVPPLKRSRFSIDVEDIDGGSPAEDSVLLDVTKPRGSPSLQCDPHLLPPGPRNYAELFNWPRRVIRRLVAEDGPCRIPEGSKAERLFRVRLTTAFSGIGAPEIAANFVQHAMFQHGMPIDINVHCQTELDETCQGLLGAPHRFLDVCGRAHVALVSKLEKMQAKYRNLLEAAKEKQPSKKPSELVQHYSNLFLRAALRLLEENNHLIKQCNECLMCERQPQCSWVPNEIAEDEFWMEVAGHPCVPWSKRGKLLHFLDPAALPTVVWAFSLKVHRPHLILNENVDSFDAESFFKLVMPEAQFFTACFSPVDLGIPTNRPRKYSVICLRPESPLMNKINYSPSLLAKVCFRRLHLTGSVYLQAPGETVKEFMDKLAALRGLPPRVEGKSYPCKHVMQPGNKIRMEQFREKVVDDGHPDFDFCVDTTQTVSFGSLSRVMPTILRNSQIYSLRGDRLFVMQELMAAQGIPRFFADDSTVHALPDMDWLRDMDSLDMRKAKGLLGNTMCLCQVGSVMAILFVGVARSAQERLQT